MFAELGWETLNCFHELKQICGSPLGRETKSEIILISRLRPALERLNPDIPSGAFELDVQELNRNRSIMSLAQANRRFIPSQKEVSLLSFVPFT